MEIPERMTQKLLEEIEEKGNTGDETKKEEIRALKNITKLVHVIFKSFPGGNMAAVGPSEDLWNKYDEISALCHENPEPVFLAENGKVDLVVMSMEAYESVTGKQGYCFPE